MDTSHLREAGLTEGEIKVYLALLDLGSATTGPIVDKSGVNRSIVYRILEKLVQKGLASAITREKTRYYQAASPGRILDYIEERKESLEQSKRSVEAMLPLLLAKQKREEGTSVRVYEGFKGIVTVHERTYDKLGRGESYFYIGGPPAQPDHLHAYWLKDHRRREKSGIVYLGLFHPDTPERDLRDRMRFRHADVRYMPLRLDTPAWFFGYADTVVIGLPAKKPVSIEIVNREIADSFRAYFQAFWKRAKPFGRGARQGTGKKARGQRA